MISHSIAGEWDFIQKDKKFLKFLCICYIIGAKEKQAGAEISADAQRYYWKKDGQGYGIIREMAGNGIFRESK